MPAIFADGITKVFGRGETEVVALRDATLEVEAGARLLEARERLLEAVMPARELRRDHEVAAVDARSAGWRLSVWRSPRRSWAICP